MKRRGSIVKPWKTRLSAGGANRTNLNGQMSRYHKRGDSGIFPTSSHQMNGSDLMPPRINNFRPWNSCLHPAQHYREWEPSPSFYPSCAPSRYNKRQRSPEMLVDDKGRPVPRKGMFLNAKYSEALPLSIDEERIRNTEEAITRMIRKSSRKGNYHYMPNYAMQDQIRQTVFNLGVPDNYRMPEQRYVPEENYTQQMEQSKKCNFPSSQRWYSKASKRGHSPMQEEDEDSMDDIDDFSHHEKEPSKRLKNSKVISPESENNIPHEKIRRHNRSTINRERLRRNLKAKRVEKPSSDEDANEISTNSNSAEVSKSSKTEASNDIRPASGGCKGVSSQHNTSQSFSPNIQYVKDPDVDDNWKNSIHFMCNPDGVGPVILERVGSAIASLPLRDFSRNSYSKVAYMLLGRSLKNLENPRSDRNEGSHPQTQITNMSTSWVHLAGNKRYPCEVDDEIVPETKKSYSSLLCDISKIRNPENATTVQLDQTLFANPRLYKFDMAIAENWMNNKMKKRLIPPPLFRSSPICNDQLRSSEGITMPSSIIREREEIELSSSGKEDDHSARQLDVDDYIARGASQLHFGNVNSEANTSFQIRSKSASGDITRYLGGSRQDNKPIDFSSKKAITGVDSLLMEQQIEENSSAPKMGTEASTVDHNSCFMLAHKKKKSDESSQPILEFDAETQKMFDDAFESDKNLK